MIQVLWFHRFRRTEKGQALVEMALVLPILIIIVFGIVEFGRIMNTYLIVTNAAREGARHGVVGGSDLNIKNAVTNNAYTLDPAKITVSINPEGTRSRGTPLSVQVSYSLDIIAPVIGAITGNPYTVTATSTMRVE